MSENIEKTIEKIVDSRIDGLKTIMFFQMIVMTNSKKYHFETYQDVEKEFSKFIRNSAANYVIPNDDVPERITG